MRRATLIFVLVNLLIVGLLVNSFKNLIYLLFEDGAEDRIHRVDIPAPGSELIDARPQLIPKIIHQTYVDENVPAKWKEGQQACIDLHSDYEYKVRARKSFADYTQDQEI